MAVKTLTMPNGAALKTTPAAKYGVRINIGTLASPVWVFVQGLTNYEPKTDPKMEDDTDISSNAWGSQANAGNEFSVDFEALVKGTKDTTFIPDPGLWALVVAAQKTGDEGHVHMQHWRTDDLPQAFEFFAAVKATLKGGKPNELQKLSGSLVGRGEPIAIVKPKATVSNLTLGSGVTAVVVTVAGQPAASVSAPVSASALQTAIRALSGQEAAVVTGSVGGPFTLQLSGDVTVAATGTGGTATVA